jgi:hypothetical protein
MSRLDDELRIAFKRKDPPPDFASRVLARLDEPAPAKKASWRAWLASFFEMPKARWAAAGLAASLMIAVAAAVYFAPGQGAGDSRPEIAQSAPAPARPPASVNTSTGEKGNPKPAEVQPNRQGTVANGSPARRRITRASNLVARRAGPKPATASPEAEAAKEKVLFALQIASDTLNDVQRVIQKESGPRGESERNR